MSGKVKTKKEEFPIGTLGTLELYTRPTEKNKNDLDQIKGAIQRAIRTMEEEQKQKELKEKPLTKEDYYRWIW